MATRDEILRFLIEVAGEQDLQGLSAALATVGTQAKNSEGEASKLAAELDKLTAAARGSAEFVRLKATLTETTAQLDEAKRGLEALNAEFSEADRSSAAVSKQFKNAEQEIARLTETQGESALQLQRVSNELQKAGVNVEDLANEERRLREEAANASRELQTQAQRLDYARDAAARNAKALDAMGDAFQRIRTNIGDVGQKLLSVGAAATAAAAAFAVYQGGKFFSEGLADAGAFESALGRIQAAAGLSADAVGGIKTAIEETAAAASKDVADAAAAFEQLTREGLTAAEAQVALRAALDFSTVAAISGADAVKVLGDAVGAFGLGAEQSANAADTLTTAAVASGLTVAEFAETIKTLGPAAADSGLSLQETAAAVQLLAQNGIEGGRAAGALAQVLGELRNPASQFSQELSNIGIESREFDVVLQQLAERGAGAEKAFLSLGGRGTLVLRALAANGGTALQGLAAEFVNVSGATARAADVINKDFDTAAANAGRAFADLRRELVEPLLEPLRIELEGLSQSLRDFAASPEFEQIRSSLVEVFQAGIDAAREFAGQVDFREVADRIAAFSTTAAADFRTLSADLAAVGQAITTVAETVSVVINALQTGVFALAAAVTGLASAGQALVAFQVDVLSTIPAVRLLAEVIGVDLPNAAQTAEERAAALQAVTEEFWQRTKTNANETRVAIDEFGEAMPRAAEKTTTAAAEIDTSSASIAQAADDTAAALEQVPDAADAAGSAIAQAAQTTQRAADDIGQATESVRQRLTRLQQELESVRVKLAEAINRGASEAEIEALELEFDRLSAAIQRTEGQLQKAGIALDDTGAAASSAASGIQQAADAADGSESSFRAMGSAVESTAFSFGAVSREALNALASMNQYVSQQRIFVERINSVSAAIRAQRDSLELLNTQLDEQLARFDPLGERLQQLKRDYSLLDEAQLREIAQKQEQLEREEERLARESERVQQETERTQQRNNNGGGTSSSGPAPRPSGGTAQGGGGTVNLTVNIEGVIGDVDRGSLEQFARQLKPILERLDRNSQ